MKLHEIKNIKKKETLLHYRNEYSAAADIEFSAAERKIIPVLFSVEMEPSGNMKINVKVTERINYPLLPVLRVLKEAVTKLEKDGALR